jgi:3-deoxy-D-manno-octulosonate 8-phosphate phosphatase (KDO 8-P phosphatase)
MQENAIQPETVLYMGDDLPDWSAMQICGIATCPADAVPEIKAIAHYVSPFAGGLGCVRDVIEKVLQAKGNWSPLEDSTS